MTRNRLLDVFLSCRAQLSRVASRIVPPHEIEDIVQETYVRMCQFRPAREIREPRALMLKIARNLALDHVKRAEARLASGTEADADRAVKALQQQLDETFQRVASDQEFVQFCDAVRQLPQQCRRVFVLKKVYGHSQKEIARELGLSESTVEKHVAKGIRACAEHMNRQGVEGAVAARAGARPATGKTA